MQQSAEAGLRRKFLEYFVFALIRNSYKPKDYGTNAEKFFASLPPGETYKEPKREAEVKKAAKLVFVPAPLKEVERKIEPIIEKKEEKPGVTKEKKQAPQKYEPQKVGRHVPVANKYELEKVGVTIPIAQKIAVKEMLKAREIPLPSLPTLPQQKILQMRTLPQFEKMELPSPPPVSETGFKEPLMLGKITSILLDPTVFSVECPGPNKNLIVNKAGQIQAAPITLTTNEINEIMDEISDKTRIPLTQGLFKAVIQDLLITALISSYVGTRFMIQKRLPFR